MFSKISRYRNLKDIVTTDARGRSRASKCIRLLPQVSGTFLHIAAEVDRLDHLAHKYYDQPEKWWRICDANPGFMSPRALLGEEPVVTLRFPVIFKKNPDQPPWFKLLKTLRQKPGVREVTLKEQTCRVNVIVTYNRLNITVPGLKNIFENEGFDVEEPGTIGRVGKTIIIPPDIVE